MFKGSVSMKVWGALSAVSLLAGCGAIADEESAPAQVRQAVTSAANPIAAGRYLHPGRCQRLLEIPSC